MEERKEGRRDFQAIVEATDNGEEVADQIFLKLLLYKDFGTRDDVVPDARRLARL